jgi:4-amino-4-deoxychorismate lyase
LAPPPASDRSARSHIDPTTDQHCLVNGEPVAQLPVTDRGLAYGDGLFETLAVRAGRPCRWFDHLDRLARGALRLQLPLPSPSQLQREAARLCMGVQRGTLKILLTRGPAARGYRPPAEPKPTRILMLNDRSLATEYDVDEAQRNAAVRVRLCHTRLGINPQLAGLKHLNRLEQVLARAEWNDSTIAEGLMCDAEGMLVGGTMTNLFILDHRGLQTPLIDRCGVAGTARGLLLAMAEQAGWAIHERRLTVTELLRARAAFLTNALIGIWPIRAIDARTFDPALLPWPLLEAVQAALLQPEPES